MFAGKCLGKIVHLDEHFTLKKDRQPIYPKHFFNDAQKRCRLGTRGLGFQVNSVAFYLCGNQQKTPNEYPSMIQIPKNVQTPWFSRYLAHEKHHII